MHESITNLMREISSPIRTFFRTSDAIILKVGKLYCGHLGKDRIEVKYFKMYIWA
jgi:hypothetical protein